MILRPEERDSLQPGRLVPKLGGADCELGNLIVGKQRMGGTGPEASRLLLRAFSGTPQSSWSASGGASRSASNGYTAGDWYVGGARARDYDDRSFDNDCRDWGRKYLAQNGGCVYIDSSHLEICTPEVRSAYDFVAAFGAMLILTRQAMDVVDTWLPAGMRIEVLVNNSDGRGNAYGFHQNHTVSRRLWDDMFHRKAHYLAFLASYLVSSIVFAGQGKVGSEDGAPAVDYQLSQRADINRKLVGLQTTYDRPIVNMRDEALCGGAISGPVWERARTLARMHCIFYDSNLCPVANLLKFGLMQILLAMMEAGQVNPSLILDDPLEAVLLFSHDPSLRSRARMASGDNLTAAELQLLFLDEMIEFVDGGDCDGAVPNACEILRLYADTLAKLRAGDLDALRGRLDWVLKLHLIRRAMTSRPSLDWQSSEVKRLDFAYSSLDPREGLFWACQSAGLVEAVVSPAAVERLVHQPPEDTRAYARAMLLREAGPERISQVDWDSISVKVPGRYGWPHYRQVDLADPAGFTKAAVGRWFNSGLALADVLDGLAGEPQDAGSGAAAASTEETAEPLLLPAPAAPGGDRDCTAVAGSCSQTDRQTPEEEGDSSHVPT